METLSLLQWTIDTLLMAALARLQDIRIATPDGDADQSRSHNVANDDPQKGTT